MAWNKRIIRPPIVIRLAPCADRLEISVEDGGRIASPGFLERAARASPSFLPTQTEIPEGGMGLFLIQSLMDEVQHHSGNDSNTVVHHDEIPAAQTSAKASGVDTKHSGLDAFSCARTVGIACVNGIAFVATEHLPQHLPTS